LHHSSKIAVAWVDGPGEENEGVCTIVIYGQGILKGS